MTDMKTVACLSVGIAVVIGMHVVLNLNSGEGVVHVRSALVPDATSADVVEVAYGGERKVKLCRTDVWRIEAPYKDVADEPAVLRLLDSLAFSDIRSELSDHELLRLGRTRDDFGLEPAVASVRVNVSGHTTDVLVGKLVPAGDEAYVAIAGIQAVFIVPTNIVAAIGSEGTVFRSKRVFLSNPEDIASIEVSSGKRQFRLYRAIDGGAWSIDGANGGQEARADVEAMVRGMLGTVIDGFVADFAGEKADKSLLAAYGLDGEAAIKVAVRRSDGSYEEVVFGCAGDRSYARVMNGASVVSVGSKAPELANADVGTLVDTRLFRTEPAEVSRLSIDGDDGKTVAVRGDDGGWRLESPIVAPADASEMKSLVNRLLSLTVHDLSGDGVSVSVGGCRPVVVSREALNGLDVSALRSREALNVSPDDVCRIMIADAGAEQVSIVRNDGKWTLEGDVGNSTVDEVAVGRILAAMSPLLADRVVRLKPTESEMESCGLRRPVRKIAVDRAETGSIRRNIIVGDEAGDARYMTVGSGDAVFTISRQRAADLLVPVLIR